MWSYETSEVLQYAKSLKRGHIVMRPNHVRTSEVEIEQFVFNPRFAPIPAEFQFLSRISWERELNELPRRTPTNIAIVGFCAVSFLVASPILAVGAMSKIGIGLLVGSTLGIWHKTTKKE